MAQGQNTGQQTNEQTNQGATAYTERALHWLRDKQLKNVYKDLLQVSTGNNTGVTEVATAISDGEATNSKLTLSWLESNVVSGLQIGGTAVTASAQEINSMDGYAQTYLLSNQSSSKTVVYDLYDKESAFGVQNNKVALGADIGVTWKTGGNLITHMQLGTAGKKDIGATADDVISWRGTDYLGKAVGGDWSGMTYAPATDGKIQTISNAQARTNLVFGSTDTVAFNNEFRHKGLFQGSSEVGYTIPASFSTDGYMYYYNRIAGANINEYRVVFVIQDGASSYTSHELIAKNISGSGGQPPPT